MTHRPASIFANCSRYYGELEDVFQVCVNSTNPCQSMERIETAITISNVDYYSSLVLFSIAGLMNIYCLFVLVPLYRKLQNDSKKKYIFLITRCIAGLIAACAWLLIQCIYLKSIAPANGIVPGYVLALVLYIGSIYVLLGSYVSMAGILYLGVLKPAMFNQYLTLRVVYIAVCIIFFIAIVLSIPLAIFQASIAIPVSIKCTDKSCNPLVTLIHSGTITGCYWFYHASEIISEASFALIESSIWSVALIMDPLINVILDKTVSRQAKNQVRSIKNQCFRLAQAITGHFSRKKKIEEEKEKEEEIPLATLQAAIAIPTASVKCTDKSCAPLITLINLILVSGSLLITIISSSFVLISLKRHRKQFKKLDTVSNTSLNSALRLLSWTLFAEILISVAEIIPFVFMEYKKHQRSTSGCYWFNHASRVVSEASFALIESSIWSIALIIDPLTNVILDTTVSKKATSQIKWAQKSFVGLARNMTGKFSRRRITNGKETQVCQEEQIIQLDTISSIT
ncbi:hypothetical protein L3Y34_000710 [Caenorhabditis briggsae]|uniref:G-protein coupled receptors family 1 profile domain-containing protein n=1 Tax=Caenorhabditis briggsae TaxID=6238 RepID=A0AAE9DA12_CAEBR|nr:hypothetical protein L3Y34_000710 [Caenorhabditis briggsae]